MLKQAVFRAFYNMIKATLCAMVFAFMTHNVLAADEFCDCMYAVRTGDFSSPSSSLSYGTPDFTIKIKTTDDNEEFKFFSGSGAASNMAYVVQFDNGSKKGFGKYGVYKHIFATKGEHTAKFWRYPVNSDAYYKDNDNISYSVRPYCSSISGYVDVPVISFACNNQVVGIESGSNFAKMFPVLDSSATPKFTKMFYKCSNLVGGIPETLFQFDADDGSVYFGRSMFEGTFQSCPNLGKDAVNGTRKYYVPANLFSKMKKSSLSSSYPDQMGDIFKDTPLSCPSGTKEVTTGYESYWDTARACEPCPAGQYMKSDKSCAKCPDGYYCPEGSTDSTKESCETKTSGIYPFSATTNSTIGAKTIEDCMARVYFYTNSELSSSVAPVTSCSAGVCGYPSPFEVKYSASDTYENVSSNNNIISGKRKKTNWYLFKAPALTSSDNNVFAGWQKCQPDATKTYLADTSSGCTDVKIGESGATLFNNTDLVGDGTVRLYAKWQTNDKNVIIACNSTDAPKTVKLADGVVDYELNVNTECGADDKRVKWLCGDYDINDHDAGDESSFTIIADGDSVTFDANSSNYKFCSPILEIKVPLNSDMDDTIQYLVPKSSKTEVVTFWQDVTDNGAIMAKIQERSDGFDTMGVYDANDWSQSEMLTGGDIGLDSFQRMNTKASQIDVVFGHQQRFYASSLGVEDEDPFVVVYPTGQDISSNVKDKIMTALKKYSGNNSVNIYANGSELSDLTRFEAGVTYSYNDVAGSGESGEDGPWPIYYNVNGGTCPEIPESVSVNYISAQVNDFTKTETGVSVTTNGDGIYHFSGTATDDTLLVIPVNEFEVPLSNSATNASKKGVVEFHNNQTFEYNDADQLKSMHLRFYSIDDDIDKTKTCDEDADNCVDVWRLDEADRFYTNYIKMEGKSVKSWALYVPSGTDVTDFTIAPAIYADGRTSAGDVAVTTYYGQENTCYPVTYDGVNALTLPTPTKEDKYFAGWQKYGEPGATITQLSAGSSGVQNLVATWSDTPPAEESSDVEYYDEPITFYCSDKDIFGKNRFVPKTGNYTFPTLKSICGNNDKRNVWVCRSRSPYGEQGGDKDEGIYFAFPEKYVVSANYVDGLIRYDFECHAGLVADVPSIDLSQISGGDVADDISSLIVVYSGWGVGLVMQSTGGFALLNVIPVANVNSLSAVWKVTDGDVNYSPVGHNNDLRLNKIITNADGSHTMYLDDIRKVSAFNVFSDWVTAEIGNLVSIVTADGTMTMFVPYDFGIFDNLPKFYISKDGFADAFTAATGSDSTNDRTVMCSILGEVERQIMTFPSENAGTLIPLEGAAAAESPLDFICVHAAYSRGCENPKLCTYEPYACQTLKDCEVAYTCNDLTVDNDAKLKALNEQGAVCEYKVKFALKSQYDQGANCVVDSLCPGNNEPNAYISDDDWLWVVHNADEYANILATDESLQPENDSDICKAPLHFKGWYSSASVVVQDNINYVPLFPLCKGDPHNITYHTNGGSCPVMMSVNASMMSAAASQAATVVYNNNGVVNYNPSAVTTSAVSGLSGSDAATLNVGRSAASTYNYAATIASAVNVGRTAAVTRQTATAFPRTTTGFAITQTETTETESTPVEINEDCGPKTYESGVGVKQSSISTPVKKGYSFVGWYKSDDCTDEASKVLPLEDKSEKILTEEDEDIDLYACFDPIKITVQYEDGFARYDLRPENNGVRTFAITEDVGYDNETLGLNSIKLPDYPYDMPAGYEFLGWCMGDDIVGATEGFKACKETATFYLPGAAIPANALIGNDTANGTKVMCAGIAKGSYNITYDLVGGKWPDWVKQSDIKKNYAFDELIYVAKPEKKGYEFERWSVEFIDSEEPSCSSDANCNPSSEACCVNQCGFIQKNGVYCCNTSTTGKTLCDPSANWAGNIKMTAVWNAIDYPILYADCTEYAREDAQCKTDENCKIIGKTCYCYDEDNVYNDACNDCSVCANLEKWTCYNTETVGHVVENPEYPLYVEENSDLANENSWEFLGWRDILDNNKKVTTLTGQTEPKVLCADWRKRGATVKFVCGADKSDENVFQVNDTVLYPNTEQDNQEVLYPNCKDVEIESWDCPGVSLNDIIKDPNDNTIEIGFKMASEQPITCKASYKIRYFENETKYRGQDQITIGEDKNVLTPNVYTHEDFVYYPSVELMQRLNINPGYRFVGWVYAQNWNNTPSTRSTRKSTTTKLAKGASGNRDLIADWDPLTYTINFDANGGSGEMNSMKNTAVVEGEGESETPVKLPANKYTRTGYVFDGWCLTSNCAEEKTIDDEAPLTDFVDATHSVFNLYAHWKPIEFKVCVQSCGDVESDQECDDYDYESDEALSELPYTVTTHNGYDFGGAWRVSYKDGYELALHNDKKFNPGEVLLQFYSDTSSPFVDYWNYTETNRTDDTDYGSSSILGKLVNKIGWKIEEGVSLGEGDDCMLTTPAVYYLGKNLISVTSPNEKFVNGITVTPQGNGMFKICGTAGTDGSEITYDVTPFNFPEHGASGAGFIYDSTDSTFEKTRKVIDLVDWENLMDAENVVINVCPAWAPHKYTINYELPTGTKIATPVPLVETYNIKDNTDGVGISAASLLGYDFKGYCIYDDESVENKPASGTVITTCDDTVNGVDKVDTLTSDAYIIVPSGSMGDKYVYPIFEPKQYKIKYTACGKTTSGKAYETETITYGSGEQLVTMDFVMNEMIPEDNRWKRDGYEFVAWCRKNMSTSGRNSKCMDDVESHDFTDNSLSTDVFVLPEDGDWDDVKEITVCADWQIINYDIVCGNCDISKTQYNVKDSKFTISEPSSTRMGYEFQGWCKYDTESAADNETTGQDKCGVSMQQEIEVPKGSTGNIWLYAVWNQETKVCGAGYYLSKDTAECEECKINHYCIGTDAEHPYEYNENEDVGATPCPEEYPESAGGKDMVNETLCYKNDIVYCKDYNTDCPEYAECTYKYTGARCKIYNDGTGECKLNTVDACDITGFKCTSGKYLHVGDDEQDANKMCLYGTKPSSNVPSLGIRVGDDTLYMVLTKEDLPISKGSNKKLRVKIGNKTYNVHDASSLPQFNE